MELNNSSYFPIITQEIFNNKESLSLILKDYEANVNNLVINILNLANQQDNQIENLKKLHFNEKSGLSEINKTITQTNTVIKNLPLFSYLPPELTKKIFEKLFRMYPNDLLKRNNPFSTIKLVNKNYPISTDKLFLQAIQKKIFEDQINELKAIAKIGKELLEKINESAELCQDLARAGYELKQLYYNFTANEKIPLSLSKINDISEIIAHAKKEFITPVFKNSLEIVHHNAGLLIQGVISSEVFFNNIESIMANLFLRPLRDEHQQMITDNLIRLDASIASVSVMTLKDLEAPYENARDLMMELMTFYSPEELLSVLENAHINPLGLSQIVQSVIKFCKYKEIEPLLAYHTDDQERFIRQVVNLAGWYHRFNFKSFRNELITKYAEDVAITEILEKVGLFNNL